MNDPKAEQKQAEKRLKELSEMVDRTDDEEREFFELDSRLHLDKK